MLTHIVMWKLKDHAEGADKATNLARAKALLESCAGLTAGIHRFEVATAQLGHECTYDLVLNSVFEDAEALNAYQSHPEHAAIKPFLGAIRTERQCMDYTHPAP
ncbi:Dabb family protein [Rhodoferax antarcticus]|uniref:Dabb family protein n=1 Tax=Rhodoferax antarcticus TaxID=81479 RepID=UPI00094F81B4|nr:Dabb family protein [Rhodoferax antarcticus]APW46322.1 stress responsive protein [Rhodoferax antarcticus]MCW2312958.1 hypothetical protein [Rhodoferax antarcticus]